MRAISLLGLLGLATATTTSSAHAPRDYDRNDYYILHLDSAASPTDVASRLGLSHEGCLGALDDHHVFSTTKHQSDVVRDALELRKRRKRDLSGGVAAGGANSNDVLDNIRLSRKQVPRKPWEKREAMPSLLPAVDDFRQFSNLDKRDEALVQVQSALMKDLDISDPIFKEQWHLLNTLQPGHDVNVKEVWRQGITGKNATVAIIDDGLDMDSDDLAANYYAAGSYDFNDHTERPKPRLSDDRHGTRCAGEVAAVRNDVCGVGVAYDSKIAGIRILSKAITDADEALAMMYDMQHNDIYSCSWGPPDDGSSMDAPSVIIKRAMLKAVQQGRDGLGSIYVFASGNGAANQDNCNFDGYTNSIYSITVGAIDRQGVHPYYSEKCSAQMVVTYSSGTTDAIHTTDVGKSNCYKGHGGTSAAAPLAAGTFALVLQIRPDLTWRDMQYLVLDSAVPVNEKDGDYQTTGRGKKFSHTYGYGKVDTFALVENAKTWKNVKPQAWFYSPWQHVNDPIPQGKDGLAVSFDVTPDMLKNSNLESVEHVTVTMNVEHTRRGDLSVDLISPQKVTSHLSTPRGPDDAKAGYVDWTFMSVAHWGESGVGTWTIIIRDSNVNEHKGKFVDWHLKLWGQAIDADKATLLPMPTEDEDDNHAITETQTADATTATDLDPLPTSDLAPISTPSDHPQRPTKIQSEDQPAATPADAAETGAAVTPPTETASDAPTESSSATDGSQDSWLPTLGVSTGAQAWIFGSVGLIAVFCSGLGFYLWRARRKAVPRDSYEFELLQEGAAGAAGEKGRKRAPRGGELYDAFAGGSDDEDLENQLLGDDDDDDDEDEPFTEQSGGSGSGSRSPAIREK